MTATDPPAPERAQWNSRIGFVLAAMGSAVGFGSISRFPMETANNGGAVFVLIYIGCMFLVGIPMMVSEFSVGRSAQSNPVGAFQKLAGRERRTPWRFAGFFYVGLTIFFLSWYGVISGWVLHYVPTSALGTYFDDPASYQQTATEGGWALIGLLVVMLMTMAVVLGGVAKGIERLNLIMMPALFAIVIFLSVYAFFQPGSGPGYAFYLKPDMGAVNLGVVASAVGQAFFSLSLGMGVMLTYASYLPKGQSLGSGATIISFSTLIFAIFCGFMIFPLLSSFGMLGEGRAGLDLIFGPLTQTFAAMGSPWGNIVGTLFFTATFFAAFSSCVSLTEPAISYFIDEHGLRRRRAVLLTVALIYTVGVLLAAPFAVGQVDFLGGELTNFFILSGGLMIGLYVGWASPKAKARERMDECDGGLRLSWFVYPMAKYVLPAILVVLLFFSAVGTPCALSGNGDGEGLFQSLGGGNLLNCVVDPETEELIGTAGSKMSGLAASGLAALLGGLMLLLLFVVDGGRKRRLRVETAPESA